MFEIDLLKGKGRPRKTDLKKVVLRLMIVLIPLGAVMTYAAGIQHDRIRLATLRNAAATNEARLDDFAQEIQFLSDLRRQINDVSLSIADIGLALKYRLVTSPILVELAERLPREVVLRDMQWRRSGTRERKTDSETGKVRFETIVQRSLRLSLYGRDNVDSDAALQSYILSLETSPAIRPFLREIRPASREQTEMDGQNVTVYEIELFLKDQR